jgi:hypothetical protein
MTDQEKQCNSNLASTVSLRWTLPTEWRILHVQGVSVVGFTPVFILVSMVTHLFGFELDDKNLTID